MSVKCASMRIRPAAWENGGFHISWRGSIATSWMTCLFQAWLFQKTLPAGGDFASAGFLMVASLLAAIKCEGCQQVRSSGLARMDGLHVNNIFCWQIVVGLKHFEILLIFIILSKGSGQMLSCIRLVQPNWIHLVFPETSYRLSPGDKLKQKTCGTKTLTWPSSSDQQSLVEGCTTSVHRRVIKENHDVFDNQVSAALPERCLELVLKVGQEVAIVWIGVRVVLIIHRLPLLFFRLVLWLLLLLVFLLCPGLCAW